VSSSFLNGASETETWTFTYDPFGRRITKVRQLRGQERERAKLLWPQPEGRADTPQVGTFFLWDGDQLTTEAPLHLGGHVDWGKATHWLYADEGSHTPIAKRLPDGATLSIVADHLGTPKEMFDGAGNLVWAADHHVWGSIRTVRTSGALALKPSQGPAEHHCPFRFPGQYEDAETGLYYNRHRHYDPLTGQYASPDPIGLAGGDRPQGYVERPTVWCDPLGLSVVGRPGAWQNTIGPADIGTGTATNQAARDYARSLGRATDDAGHARGRNLGGSGTDLTNIFPQAIAVNRGAFRAVEQQIANRVKTTGQTVQTTLTPTYPGSSFRPSSLDYRAVFSDGTVWTRTFSN
jgi:RHS repeat-associated protein